MSEMLQCKKCGAELTRPQTGRPPDYCSKGCRRAAQHEVQRLQRHLEDLERRETGARRELGPAARLGGSAEFRRAEHRWFLGELDRLEKRLRQLLD
jgi:hypothetical protein